MKPLFSIATEYQSLYQKLSDNDELFPEDLNAIELIADDLEIKAVNIGSIIKNMEHEAESIWQAIDAMEKRYSSVCKKVGNLKEYLKSNLERCEIKEIKSPFFDIKIRNNPASVRVVDETLIPESYFKEKITRSLDKAMISKELKELTEIPGVILAHETRIEIK